jgi:hypothetical protein
MVERPMGKGAKKLVVGDAVESVGEDAKGTRKTPNLPSWVPDRKTRIDEPVWQKGRLDWYQLYNACGG